MPSSPTTRNRLNKQGTGENLNTWGANLNTGALDLIDAALDGLVSFSLSGARTLTSANYVDDEARRRIIFITGGTGGSVTVPSVEKLYIVRNGSSGNVTVGHVGGSQVTVPPGAITLVICDGANAFGGGTDLVTLAAANAYTDATAFTANAGILPGQTGNAGEFLSTNGTNALWQAVTVAAISDYVADQLTRANALRAQAIAFAVAL
jgi:hypothetical protein